MSNILEMQKEIAEVKPLPLPSDKKQLPRFNIDCLPKVIADYVSSLANAHQQPIQYIATSSLVSIAGLLGNKVCLDIDDRKAYPILWGMLIGDSGTGKTPSINEPMKPIKEIDKQLLDDYLKDYANYQTALELYEIELKKLKAKLKDCKDEQKQSIKGEIEAFKKLKPIKPYSREICINTATKEALLSQLADDSPNGLILEIDELMDFIQSVIRAEKIEDHKLYVEAYNNGSFKSKTISRGTQYIDNVTISIIGGVQTQRLIDFTNKYNGSGLLARFQLIPIAEKYQREYKEAKLSFDIKSSYENLLNSLKQIPQRFNIVDNEKVKTEPKKYNYTSEAKRLYIDWFNNIEKVKNESGQSDLMIEYLGKATNTFHALALIYHLADNQDNYNINKEVVQKVIATLEYFYDCADYLYGYNFNKSLDLAKKIVDIKSKLNNKKGFSIGDITRPTSYRKLDKELVQEALDILEQYHHIIKTDKKGTKYYKYHWL
ncbi:DUF3987 domain-containing protein [Francisella adeliensis]|uniref:DUF3987 domain-containing protein n=1 Tax=Francisella adeliensis TaxID=2007306 RepID=A0A2Z4XWE4_9GAMM|nr:DUF3987 domain-containing protein [Francisella adeliensis]AXA33174.1 hypothetical protein CDH04_01500 [Francisella adeliensis]MBK2085934.1 DUF3987 domain-containing protein [Francisella adeliensis]MBK2096902.1 DUF3987 domain-containing protein [Francisella adeliensis]QIW11402.1 DUF3987 domain-containing protein [Francisella adeliensis]QIW13277.1 DUF3987 domain-containing protein [Francisella adeliensis]